MRTLGIIGGLSWASSLQYYRFLNEGIRSRLGRQASADILMRSVNFQPVIDAQERGDWNAAGAILCEAAQGLERGGAAGFLIASNTMHLVVDQVAQAVKIPALSIFDATATAIRDTGIKKAALLGTRYTMNLPFFREEYARRGIEVIVPSPRQAAIVNQIIFRELIHNRIEDTSRQAMQDIMRGLADDGAGGIILGCTELELLVKPEFAVAECPVFDTTRLHVEAALGWMLRE